MHAYLSEFVTYLIKFIFLLAVSAGGVFFGKKLAVGKMQKRSQKAKEEAKQDQE
ncbi:hypothetical protein [Anaerostipes sp.]|uniref:hypothetical protein n=1 Tax=Anaerostipes sp. TaxID=1872530 RepID=UPI0025BCD4CA|nr:hypothetical protein [Anaerostipes sp.]MBS7008028.1 hypothetical protein [Anaerostipes sp.]